MAPGTSSRIAPRRAAPVAVAATAVAAALAGWSLRSWLTAPAPFESAERVPVLRAAERTAAAPPIDLAGFFRPGPGKPSALTGAWPRFRGAEADNIARQDVPLADTWPADGPPVRWSVDLGDGHAGAAVRDGRVYILDYDVTAQADTLRCLSLDDGREIWARGYHVAVKSNHGRSRTVPAVADGLVLTIGPRCQVLCADAETGAFRWGVDLQHDYGTKEPLWYTAQCPLIDRGVAVLAPAGRVLLTGLDGATGAVRWETPNPDGWNMSHASVVSMTWGGRRMYVYAALGGVAGVAADGDRPGEVLWKSTDWNHAVVAPSPVILPGGRIFLTAGYGVGSLLLQLHEEDGRFRAETVYHLDKSVFACEQQTPIFYRDRLFGVLPNDAGARRRQLACFDPAGQTVWSSGKTARFGLGPFLIGDGKLFVLDDGGTLTMARASTEAWEPLASARVLRGPDAWGPMALVDGRLLLRDLRRMICLDLRARRPAGTRGKDTRGPDA